MTLGLDFTVVQRYLVKLQNFCLLCPPFMFSAMWQWIYGYSISNLHKHWVVYVYVHRYMSAITRPQPIPIHTLLLFSVHSISYVWGLWDPFLERDAGKSEKCAGRTVDCLACRSNASWLITATGGAVPGTTGMGIGNRLLAAETQEYIHSRRGQRQQTSTGR